MSVAENPGTRTGPLSLTTKAKKNVVVPQLKISLRSRVKPKQVGHTDFNTTNGQNWLSTNGLALVSKLVSEFTSLKILRLHMDGC